MTRTVKEKATMSFETAKAQYVHRYTMEHVPAWALTPMTNGKYFAPQFRSDREWYDNTKFPPQHPMGPRVTDCYTTGMTWPLGKSLDTPFKVNK